jgi:LAS superfamily LD-carboxypeptidase LdcB
LEATLTGQAISFGRYRLERLLGAGEEGSVYRATLAGDTAPVALRLLSARLLEDPSFSARLEGVGGALAALDHPALNPALDWGIEAGQPFLVTSLEPGRPLDEVDLGQLDPAEKVGLIVQALDAIARVHEAGLVHGGLRPANLALRPGGRLGVTDTALALLVGAPPRPGNPYLSPETAAGAPLDAAADCHALGVILYQLLTGLLPSDPPVPPSSVQPGVPPTLDAPALRLIAQDPGARFPSAAAAAEALRPYAAPGGSGRPKPNSSPTVAIAAPWLAWVAELPKPPLVASALTALLLGVLTATTIVGAGQAANRPGAIDTFIAPARLAAEPSPASKPVTPTLPVVEALPPPVVITASGALSSPGIISRTLSGTAPITAYGTLSTSTQGALSTAGTLSGARPSAPVTPTMPPPPPVQSNPDAMMYVVSKRQGVPEQYTPADLVPLDGLLKTLKPNLRLRRAVLDAFRRMTDAMRAAGLEPAIVEAFLSPAEQREAFAKLVAQHGQAGAERLAPRPGYDEHQLGTVIDFVSGSQGYRLDDRFNDSPEGRWLLANAAKYGFIQSYPAGKDAVIGFKARPWQYRYVGELAYDIASRGQTLEEYVAARR